MDNEAKDLEIAKLRAALEQCAGDYISAPCTIEQGHHLLASEFCRRMQIAADALST